MAEKLKAPKSRGALRKRRPADNIRERIDRAKCDHFFGDELEQEWEMEHLPPSHESQARDFIAAWKEAEARTQPRPLLQPN